MLKYSDPQYQIGSGPLEDPAWLKALAAACQADQPKLDAENVESRSENSTVVQQAWNNQPAEPQLQQQSPYTHNSAADQQYSMNQYQQQHQQQQQQQQCENTSQQLPPQYQQDQYLDPNQHYQQQSYMQPQGQYYLNQHYQYMQPPVYLYDSPPKETNNYSPHSQDSTTNDKSTNNADRQGSKRGDESPEDGGERKPPAPDQSQGLSSLISGIFRKIFEKKDQPTRIKLPDDKNPTIIWDEAEKKWVNKNEQGDDDNDAKLAPPPIIRPALNRSVPAAPSSTSSAAPNESSASTFPPPNQPNQFRRMEFSARRTQHAISSGIQVIPDSGLINSSLLATPAPSTTNSIFPPTIHAMGPSLPTDLVSSQAAPVPTPGANGPP